MKANNGQTIFTSVAYHTKESCLQGIESLKQHAIDKDRYECKKSLHLKHYFDMSDSNGQQIGFSEMYESSSGRDLGIALLKMNVTGATTEDLTVY
jgi:uncharacterized protein YegP (UPF0339 family)